MIFVTLFIISINANNSKYIEKKDYKNQDYRIFTGAGASYSYFRASENLDKLIYAYSVYVGMPIYFGNELIIKNKINIADEFSINQQSLILNIPIISRSTRQVYIGIIAGIGELKWNNDYINSLNITKKTIDKNFYGLHIGKRYKYTRNFYIRMEIEYMQYSYLIPTNHDDMTIDNSIAFNYGFEYRF
jgi:hypothetical protein